MRKNPCWQCTKRRIGCHSECESYICWKKDHDEEAALIRKNKVGDDIYIARYRKLNSNNKGETK